MLRIFCLVTLSLIFLTACSSEPVADPTADAETLLAESVNLIRESESFSLIVEQGGEPFRFIFQLGPDLPEFITVMSRATGSFIAPDGLYADARIQFEGVSINVQLFAKTETQWVKALGLPYVEYNFAPGFNPSILMAEDSGFNRALSQLDSLEYVGRENRNRIDTHHVRGETDGDVINDLLFGLLEILEERVIVDVFIDVETGYPAEMLLTLPDTATDENEDTYWLIEIFDVNEPLDIDTPDEVDL